VAGRFINFEGIDGAGKSTQVTRALAWATARGIEHVATREPGGTVLGEALRAIVLDARRRIDPDTELLLMFAARSEHLAEVIRPALAAGRWVFCDRFTDATHAYQGGGRGLAQERIAALEDWVQQGLQPDLTLLFDVDPARARARRSDRSEAPDRFEAEALDFHTRVREAYLRRAGASEGRIVVIDASRPVQEVGEQVAARLEALVA
jgi:dTMP kinase